MGLSRQVKHEVENGAFTKLYHNTPLGVTITTGHFWGLINSSELWGTVKVCVRESGKILSIHCIIMVNISVFSFPYFQKHVFPMLI